MTRNLFYCGMSHHVSIMENGFATYIKQMTRELCMEMYKEQETSVNHVIIKGLRFNATNHYSITLGNNADAKAHCSGTYYEDVYGKWENIVALADFAVALGDSEVLVYLEHQEITRPAGVRCKLGDGHCLNHDGDTRY